MLYSRQDEGGAEVVLIDSTGLLIYLEEGVRERNSEEGFTYAYFPLYRFSFRLEFRLETKKSCGNNREKLESCLMVFFLSGT